MEESESFRSLIDAIAFRCDQNPRARAVVFLTEGGQAQEVSNEQFYNDIRRYASGFIVKNIQPGEIVLLALDHGYELLSCFWGAICCGAIPSILTYWRFGSDVDAYARKVKILVEAVRARALITMPALYSATSAALEQIKCLVFRAEEIAAGSPQRNVALPELRAEQIALLQFTSGSTDSPKAVRFSHRAVLEHVTASAEAYRLTPESIAVSWLPFYHDMGLIGHVRALVHGSMLVTMSPQSWLCRPEMLLHAVSRYHGTITNMPNFGFDYCVQRIRAEDLAGFDLNSWKILSNGSEPVNINSMQRFAKKFAVFGFDCNSLTVAYGMAENVMGVSVTPPGQALRVDWVEAEELYLKKQAVTVEPGSTGAQAIVSCGYPYRGIELKIVADNWSILAEREVGEIVIRSNTLFSGYYLSPEDNESLFREGWFRTGDLGYIADGQLYVCGRKKDLIIVGGKNIHPETIENIASRVFGSFASRCVAFGFNDSSLGTETPVLVIEQKKQLDDTERQSLISQVRKQVLDELDVALSDVRLVPKGWVIKTTSGKIARSANRKKYLDEQLNANQTEEHRISPSEVTPKKVEQLLTGMFEKVLGASGIDRNEDFLKLGGDSLSALRLLIEIEQRFGQEISAADFFQEPTVKHVASVLQRQRTKASDVKTVNPLNLELKRQLTPEAITQTTKFGNIRTKTLKYLDIRENAKIIYKAKFSFLAWIYGQKWAQKVFNAERVRLILQFYKLIENPGQTETETVQCGLVLNHSENIKRQLSDQVISRNNGYWSLKVDTAPLEFAYQRGKGVIIVGTHVALPLIGLVKKVALESLNSRLHMFIRGVPGFLIENVKSLSAEEKRRARLPILLDQLMRSKSMLKQGGIVFILPDGGGGISRSISFPFHGRLRGFRTGFAELAIETGAEVIPASLSVDVCKKLVKISFLEPLSIGPADKSHSEHVDELVRQYAEFLEKEWACYPGGVPLRQMRRHILSRYG